MYNSPVKEPDRPVKEPDRHSNGCAQTSLQDLSIILRDHWSKIHEEMHRWADEQEAILDKVFAHLADDQSQAASTSTQEMISLRPKHGVGRSREAPTFHQSAIPASLVDEFPVYEHLEPLSTNSSLGRDGNPSLGRRFTPVLPSPTPSTTGRSGMSGMSGIWASSNSRDVAPRILMDSSPRSLNGGTNSTVDMNSSFGSRVHFALKNSLKYVAADNGTNSSLPIPIGTNTSDMSASDQNSGPSRDDSSLGNFSIDNANKTRPRRADKHSPSDRTTYSSLPFFGQSVGLVARRLQFQRIHTSGIWSPNKKKHRSPFGRLSKTIGVVVYSSTFDSLCATVIILNAIIIGISADHEIKNIWDPEIKWIGPVEFGFCVYYTLEVILRMLVQGPKYFTETGAMWNWFDVALVVQGINDQIINLLVDDDPGSQNWSFLRLLRLMRMMKLLRMIRLMHFFKELRMILYSMMGSIKAMFWAIMLMLLLSYMFGIMMLQGCASHLQGMRPGSAEALQETEKTYEHWGSVVGAMNSLFMVVTSGMDWHEVVQPVHAAGDHFYILFLMYIGCFVFVVTNTITSIFVESAIEHSQKDHQFVIQLELEKKHVYVQKLQAFYDEIDTDKQGVISYEKFCEYAEDPRMLAFAASLEIDILNAKQFFCMLSDSGTRLVDVETFVVGCIKLKGMAKNMDLMELIYSHKKAVADQAKTNELICSTLRRIEGAVGHSGPLGMKACSLHSINRYELEPVEEIRAPA